MAVFLSRSPRIILGLLLFLTIPVVCRAAWPNNPAANVPLCTATGSQDNPGPAIDGSGGMIVAWEDSRGANIDIYAQRVSSNGVPLWITDGVIVCSATGNQARPMAVSDGAGGAIVTWYDARNGNWDIYAQRLDANGQPQWTDNGVPLCTATGDQAYPLIVTDGSGGAIVVWNDWRSDASGDLYAQRINASGAVQWIANGDTVVTITNTQDGKMVVPDGMHGVIVAWRDTRAGGNDVYAQRLNGSGQPVWTANGVLLCNYASGQTSPDITGDGYGGAFVVWMDDRATTSNYDLFAQYVQSTGSVMWPASGVAVCTAATSQYYPKAASDGEGGAIFVWSDWRNPPAEDIYAQRLNLQGVPQWTADGVLVCGATERQHHPWVIGDGEHGCIVVWNDERLASRSDLYAQRLYAGGGEYLWDETDVPVSSRPSNQSNPALVTDGAGGVLVAWRDEYSNYNIYAQRVDHFGQRGAQPTITSVQDVPNDNGGFVKVSFNSSPLDSFPYYGINSYSVYRSVPPHLASRALERGALLVSLDEADPGWSPRAPVMAKAANGTFWELVYSFSASHLPGYSVVIATECDSIADSNPMTWFMVKAVASEGDGFWYSDADSGYSVDNLAPAMPSPFTGSYASGASTLRWGRNGEADLAQYRLHRGHEPDFVPDAGNLVAALHDSVWTDAVGAPFFYKLCAVDIHGNVSPYAFCQPSGTAGVAGAAVPAEVWLARAAPNPARGECVIRFGLPARTRLSLAVHDVQGRRVRTLARGEWAAGEHDVRWDGRDDAGVRVKGGLFFARLETPQKSLTTRIVVTH
jgi:predicted lipoprotein with Yx(FWY)xxD motif